MTTKEIAKRISDEVYPSLIEDWMTNEIQAELREGLTALCVTHLDSDEMKQARLIASDEVLIHGTATIMRTYFSTLTHDKDRKDRELMARFIGMPSRTAQSN